jgi:hypothetical protein
MTTKLLLKDHQINPTKKKRFFFKKATQKHYLPD